jgi:hypothetical protein
MDFQRPAITQHHFHRRSARLSSRPGLGPGL